METFTAPTEQTVVSVHFDSHPLTDDTELNAVLCRPRTVRFERVSDYGRNRWQPLFVLQKVVV